MCMCSYVRICVFMYVFMLCVFMFVHTYMFMLAHTYGLNILAHTDHQYPFDHLWFRSAIGE